jgi:hypothetical protein
VGGIRSKEAVSGRSDPDGGALVVGSKYSCGALIELEQTAEALVTLYGADATIVS